MNESETVMTDWQKSKIDGFLAILRRFLEATPDASMALSTQRGGSISGTSLGGRVLAWEMKARGTTDADAVPIGLVQEARQENYWHRL